MQCTIFTELSTTVLFKLWYFRCAAAKYYIWGWHWSCTCNIKCFLLYIISILIGILCDCNVQFCSCLPEFVQLLQFGLWGGTPSKPRIAFAIDFLELIHAIQMECHASLKGICQAFEVSHSSKITTTPASRKLYPVIIDAFEEYRCGYCLYFFHAFI